MATSGQHVDQFVELLQRFIHLRPKLAFPDEDVASLRRQMQDLRKDASGDPGERIFLLRILETLMRSDAPPTMGELSAQLGLPLSSATRMADALVRAKLAERRPDANDRRVVRLCMTESGGQFIQMAMTHVKQHVVQLLKHFSPDEQTQLLHLMKKLVDSLQAERQEQSR